MEVIKNATHKYRMKASFAVFWEISNAHHAPEKDMLELIGHTDISMTRYY